MAAVRSVIGRQNLAEEVVGHPEQADSGAEWRREWPRKIAGLKNAERMEKPEKTWRQYRPTSCCLCSCVPPHPCTGTGFLR